MYFKKYILGEKIFETKNYILNYCAEMLNPALLYRKIWNTTCLGNRKREHVIKSVDCLCSIQCRLNAIMQTTQSFTPSMNPIKPVRFKLSYPESLFWLRKKKFQVLSTYKNIQTGRQSRSRQIDSQSRLYHHKSRYAEEVRRPLLLLEK